MPNWCYNTLTIAAEPHVITALRAKAQGKPSPDSEETVPFSYLPFVQEQLDACPDFAVHWYEWMLEHVGCKGFPEIDPACLDVETDVLSMSFESPWGPPLEGTRAIAAWLRAQGGAFSLTLTYEEPNGAFCGVFTMDEEREEDLCGEYAELES